MTYVLHRLTIIPSLEEQHIGQKMLPLLTLAGQSVEIRLEIKDVDCYKIFIVVMGHIIG